MSSRAFAGLSGFVHGCLLTGDLVVTVVQCSIEALPFQWRVAMIDKVESKRS